MQSSLKGRAWGRSARNVDIGQFVRYIHINIVLYGFCKRSHNGDICFVVGHLYIAQYISAAAAPLLPNPNVICIGIDRDNRNSSFAQPILMSESLMETSSCT